MASNATPIVWNITREQAQTLLNALATRPLAEVMELFTTLLNETNRQIAEADALPATPEPKAVKKEAAPN